jgi:hypothetical protein
MGETNAQIIRVSWVQEYLTWQFGILLVNTELQILMFMP